MRVCPQRHYHVEWRVENGLHHYWCQDCGAIRVVRQFQNMPVTDTGWKYPAITEILRGRKGDTVRSGVYVD